MYYFSDARLEWTIPIMVSSTQLLRAPPTTSSILSKLIISKPTNGLSRDFRQALCQLEGYIHTANKENQNEMLVKLKSLVAKFE